LAGELFRYAKRVVVAVKPTFYIIPFFAILHHESILKFLGGSFGPGCLGRL
jgi:hypothetical protein